MHEKYFEGVLQLRNPNDEARSYIQNHVKKASAVFVSKIVRHKNGLDYYLSSKKFLHQLVKRLQNSFGGEYSISPRLFSRDRQTSKDIHRINVLFILPEFKKGECIYIDNKIIKITNISKNISGNDIQINKKITFSIKNKEYGILNRKKTIVIRIKPAIEVLDPETYQNAIVNNKADVKIGE